MSLRIWAGIALLSTLVACQPSGQTSSAAAPPGVDSKALLSASGNTRDWLSVGRTYDEQRYSPLENINPGNVKDLGLAWFADLDTARGQEATPLAIDGRLYVSTAWSKVKAYDGATGKLLWAFDPQVSGETGVRACCDVVNRGLAAWGRRLYLGALDGRLIALDRDTGKPSWSVQTTDPQMPYTITMAPRVIDGRVIIGNSGSEYGVRGYVSAYDAETGKQLWRFYTVPDQPGKNPAEYLKKAEATWHGQYWKLGGGGTVWDGIAYDPELDLLYIGVDNGTTWPHQQRSPGGGDNLYLASIVALRPKTGEYVWHYQVNPGESWDFSATQHIMLADLNIGGQVRKVLMQAPKNGYFYVLDRATGQLLSANNFVPTSWAKGIDLATGRPIENPEARYDETSKFTVVTPGAGGAHNWQPMAFNSNTGLVYIPAIHAAFPYVMDKNFKPVSVGVNMGIDQAATAMPADPKIRAAAVAATTGALIAWDPVAQKERWHVDHKGPWNGGLLSTAGGLVFQGDGSKNFAAYDAATGAVRWSSGVQTGVVAAPMTYSVDGEQYVAVLAGWGGIFSMAPGVLSEVGGPVRNISRLLVFKLHGTVTLPPEPPLSRLPLDPPPFKGSAAQVADGAKSYGRSCGMCHGDAAYGSLLVPDLRRSGLLNDAKAFAAVVHDGLLKDKGMVGFSAVLAPEQVENVRQYIIKRANEDKQLGVK